VWYWGTGVSGCQEDTITVITCVISLWESSLSSLSKVPVSCTNTTERNQKSSVAYVTAILKWISNLVLALPL